MSRERRGPCEAPVHSENCLCQTCATRDCGNCRYLTEDHFTPKSIAKKLRWGNKQINNGENIQWLSPPCHTEKDRTTPRRLQEVIFQEKGGTIGLGEHLIFELPKREDKQ